MDKKRTKTSRSRTGCLTCRKRKKKCDELSYPTCQSCASKNVECIWPATKHELHRKLEQVKYVEDSSKVPVRQEWKSPKHKQGSFLERIAMQQDCVVDYTDKAPKPVEKSAVANREDVPTGDTNFNSASYAAEYSLNSTSVNPDPLTNHSTYALIDPQALLQGMDNAPAHSTYLLEDTPTPVSESVSEPF